MLDKGYLVDQSVEIIRHCYKNNC